MSRFPGWTCFADKVPLPGELTVGFAGADDDRVWHPGPCRWDGTRLFNRYDNPMPPIQPARTFYQERP